MILEVTHHLTPKRPNYILVVNRVDGKLENFHFTRMRRMKAVKSIYDVGFWRITKHKPKQKP